MKNFNVRIEKKGKKGFSKRQLESLYRNLHGGDADIEIEEVEE